MYRQVDSSLQQSLLNLLDEHPLDGIVPSWLRVGGLIAAGSDDFDLDRQLARVMRFQQVSDDLGLSQSEGASP